MQRDGEQLKSLMGVGQEKRKTAAAGRSCCSGWPASSCQPSPQWSSVDSPSIPIRIHLRLHIKPSFGTNRPILNGFIRFQRGRIFLFPDRSKLKLNSRMQSSERECWVVAFFPAHAPPWCKRLATFPHTCLSAPRHYRKTRHSELFNSHVTFTLRSSAYVTRLSKVLSVESNTCKHQMGTDVMSYVDSWYEIFTWDVKM